MQRHKLSFVLVFCVLFWVAFAYVTVLSHIKANVTYPANTTKLFFRSISTQGWGFFTKSPREMMITLYKKKGSGWDEQTVLGNNIRYYFGADRTSRAIGMDIDNIVSGIAKGQFIAFKGDFRNNVPIDIQKIKYDSKLFTVLTQGEYVLIEERLEPWVYSLSNQNNNKPKLIIHLNVQ